MNDYLEYEINKELAECYLFMNDLDKAESYYKKAHQASGSFSNPMLGLATIAVQRGELQNAMDFYQQAFDMEPTDKALAGKGLVAMELGQDSEAFGFFCEALTVNCENAVALNCLIRAAYTLARVPEAIPFLERAIEVDIEKTDLRVTLAGCLMNIGKVDEAKTHLEFVLAKDPEAGDAKDLYKHIAA